MWRPGTSANSHRRTALPAHASERESLGGDRRRIALQEWLPRLGSCPLTSLLERARQGDRRALDELCREEWPTVYRLVAAKVSSRQEAEDVTQEVFLRALRRLPETATGWDSVRPYLVIVAQNLLRDRWRQSRRVSRVDADMDSFETTESGPEEATLLAERRSLLVVSLARLPAQYQHVLRLRLLEGRSAVEVGNELGRSPEAVRQLQHRALVALRSELADEERDISYD